MSPIEAARENMIAELTRKIAKASDTYVHLDRVFRLPETIESAPEGHDTEAFLADLKTRFEAEVTVLRHMIKFLEGK